MFSNYDIAETIADKEQAERLGILTEVPAHMVISNNILWQFIQDGETKLPKDTPFNAYHVNISAVIYWFFRLKGYNVKRNDKACTEADRLYEIAEKRYTESLINNPDSVLQDIQKILDVLEKQDFIQSREFDLSLTRTAQQCGNMDSYLYHKALSEENILNCINFIMRSVLYTQIEFAREHEFKKPDTYKQLSGMIKAKLLDWYSFPESEIDKVLQEYFKFFFPVKQEIISVSAIVPELIHYPVDKVSQNLFRYLEDGTYSMNVEKAGSADNLETIVTLDFEELRGNKALADIIDRILTPFDKRVYVAAGTLQQAKNKYISATQIYKQMGGKGSPAAKHISKIVESCTKMMGIRLSINNQEEAAKYPKYKEFQRGLFFLFPVEIVENVSINGQTTDFCLHFLKDELPLFKFAKQRKQITEYTLEQWSLPFYMTDDNILLDDYFRSRTARMRRDKARSKNHSYNGKMLYNKIYENCGIDTAKKRFDSTKKIRKLLNHYKVTGIIIDYQEGKDGIRITV
jgi:DNA-binding phage protein